MALRRLPLLLAAFFRVALRARAFPLERDFRVGFRLRVDFPFFFLLEVAFLREALRDGFFRREAFRFALFFATVSPPLKRVYQCTND
jgi:hypothetical protein